MKLQKKLKNKVTGKALALLAPAHLLVVWIGNQICMEAGPLWHPEIGSDVIELKATVEGLYHHLETLKFIIFQGRFQCNSLRLAIIFKALPLLHVYCIVIMYKPKISLMYLMFLYLTGICYGWCEVGLN